MPIHVSVLLRRNMGLMFILCDVISCRANQDAHLNLSTDMLIHVTREFMRQMAQPFDKGHVGKSLLTEEAVNAMSTA